MANKINYLKQIDIFIFPLHLRPNSQKRFLLDGIFTCGCGEIGRHARLRIWCREAWGFESLHPHQKPPSLVEAFFIKQFYSSRDEL